MEKKILIPVDDSRPSLRAVRYGIHAAAFINDLHFVLFHVQPAVSLYLKEEAVRDLHVRAKVNQMLQKNETVANDLLNRLKKEMTDAGIAEARIETVTRPRTLGLAQDVIEYGQENLFDAIVLGRRRLTGISKFFGDSVSAAILERSQVLPVWLVDGNGPADKEHEKILVAVDGSESSLRAVDHVGFMVSENPDVRLTLLHVTNTARTIA